MVSSNSPSPKLGIDLIALVRTGSSTIGDIPNPPRSSCIDIVRGREGIVGGANGFGPLLAVGRFGMVEYENCNFRGSFQVKNALSFREVREVRETPCSCALSSSGLHPPSVTPPGFSTSQSLVSQ
jgi:hypothetical protein